jgi:Fe-S oxidoreductase
MLRRRRCPNVQEEERGTTRVNFERTEEAISTGAKVIASACPFCNTMLTDGVKNAEKESEVKVMDVAELIVENIAEPDRD